MTRPYPTVSSVNFPPVRTAVSPAEAAEAPSEGTSLVLRIIAGLCVGVVFGIIKGLLMAGLR